jgi:hypothetical protein
MAAIVLGVSGYYLGIGGYKLAGIVRNQIFTIAKLSSSKITLSSMTVNSPVSLNFIRLLILKGHNLQLRSDPEHSPVDWDYHENRWVWISDPLRWNGISFASLAPIFHMVQQA